MDFQQWHQQWQGIVSEMERVVDRFINSVCRRYYDDPLSFVASIAATILSFGLALMVFCVVLARLNRNIDVEMKDFRDVVREAREHVVGEIKEQVGGLQSPFFTVGGGSGKDEPGRKDGDHGEGEAGEDGEEEEDKEEEVDMKLLWEPIVRFQEGVLREAEGYLGVFEVDEEEGRGMVRRVWNRARWWFKAREAEVLVRRLERDGRRITALQVTFLLRKLDKLQY